MITELTPKATNTLLLASELPLSVSDWLEMVLFDISNRVIT